jgi:hypothetical protein
MLTRPTCRLPAAVCALLALAGCATSNGPPYRVQTQSATGITFLTDPSLRNLPLIQAAAQSHCAGLGKQAVQTRIYSRLRAGQAAIYFACR